MKWTSRALWLQLLVTSLLVGGCAMKPQLLKIDGYDSPLAAGVILDTANGHIIEFDQLVEQLLPTRVIYVGERHTSANHHDAQLQIIRALNEKKGAVRVGMEMFDHTYQAKLDQWSDGKWDWPEFLKQIHWYANWRFDDALYKPILDYIQENRLKLVGLNIPFHLPPKIAVGGIDSLSESERALLPKTIDTSQADHRAYVEEIFKSHTIKGREDFNNFYAAQCAWEDGMAQAVAEQLAQDTMVVVVGNGHIVRKYGIPDRAFARNAAPFQTVIMATPHSAVSLEDGDYIWVTPSEKPSMPRMMKR